MRIILKKLKYKITKPKDNMANNTDQFFELVERTFNVDEITPEKIMDEFYSGSFGDIKKGKDRKGKQRYEKSKATISGQSVFRGLAERLADGNKIVLELEKTNKIEDLKELKQRANNLDIHKKEVENRIEVKETEIKVAIEEGEKKIELIDDLKALVDERDFRRERKTKIRSDAFLNKFDSVESFEKELDHQFKEELTEIVDDTELPNDRKRELKKVIPDMKVVAEFEGIVKRAKSIYNQEQQELEKENRITDLTDQAKSTDDLEELKDIRNKAHKLRRSFPDKFEEIKNLLEEKQIEQREARLEEARRITREGQKRARLRKEQEEGEE